MPSLNTADLILFSVYKMSCTDITFTIFQASSFRFSIREFLFMNLAISQLCSVLELSWDRLFLQYFTHRLFISVSYFIYPRTTHSLWSGDVKMMISIKLFLEVIWNKDEIHQSGNMETATSSNTKCKFMALSSFDFQSSWEIRTRKLPMVRC